MELGVPRQHRLLIPRTLWIAWHQGLQTAPDLVQACIQRWAALNPAWSVRVVTYDDWSHWLPAAALQRYSTLPELKPAHQADWLRLQLLLHHGGVWADATVLCRQPLDAWLPERCDEGFFAFANPGPDRLLSNWFLASSPDHPLMQHWSKRYEQLLRYPRPKWCKPLQKPLRRWLKHRLKHSPHAARIWCHPLTHRLSAHLPYFGQHYCFTEILRTQPPLRALWRAVPTLSAGPCHWLQFHADEGGAGNAAAPLRKPTVAQAPVFKLNRRVNTPNQAGVRAELKRNHGGV
ncbi:capsular polysaccharide synthesis family protein [Synechococcus sp. WH 8101]|uniref:capsular polysaccharide synthesis protein n=1 Tax=Synechococcus sp. WH 8101 TaxID=59932 RepID=UPI0010236ADF|nr:capsular polysaccharide synthesis protein [Synechococcus sp. WH 8101]QNI44026.1 capsular polysaccharide synthesis family protein [Synechococcus sp. WH 8101]